MSSDPWFANRSPKHFSLATHKSHVVTCLIISHKRIITASDDSTISIYSLGTAELVKTLEGHEGGVWTIAASASGDMLVSGSTDRTVRMWNLQTLRCTHVFRGHTSSVRRLVIVEPELVDVTGNDGSVMKEIWPKETTVVTGSRDHTLRIWTLPKPGDEEYEQDEESEVESNPYHRLLLPGHEHAVRDLAAKGRTVVSGSFDCSLRVWDISTGECKWILIGHTMKVYAVALDLDRNRAYSGSMDSNVRVWDLATGQCVHTLTGHISFVGLLEVSSSFLVSGSADSTIRIWDPDTGEVRHVLEGHSSALTTFHHDEWKLLTGSEGVLRLWNIRDGKPVMDLLSGVDCVWQTTFDGRLCVAVSNGGEASGNMLHVWDFGQEDNVVVG